MNDTKKYTVKHPREGLTQFVFENGYTLSVGCGKMHYSHNLGGIPTSFEIAVVRPFGGFVPLTEHDDVAGYQPLSMVETLLQKMGRDDFDAHDLELFCE